MTILKNIVESKEKEIARKKDIMPLSGLVSKVNQLNYKCRGFKESLLRDGSRISIIAELKRKSPSKGVLRSKFNPEELAKGFEANGAGALSILTDDIYFGGSLDFLKRVRQVTSIPLLRKDFIIDEYQIYESLINGADAVLLISGILNRDNISAFVKKSNEMGLDCLIEIHSTEDLDKVLDASIDPKKTMIGINNRNLETFEINLDNTEEIIGRVPKEFSVVTESGIKTREDLSAAKALGVKAALVGETLMREKDPGLALKNLRGDL
jgi:indole-3-glycerol phosphate synthase